MWRRWAAFLTIVIAMWFVPGEREAAAEDVTAKIYDDVKDVLQDLIRKEASKGVVRYMLRADTEEIDSWGARACEDNVVDRTNAGKLDNIFAFYFHDAIDRLYSGQLGSLGREMQGGLVDLVTDAVYLAVSNNVAKVIDNAAKVSETSTQQKSKQEKELKVGELPGAIAFDLAGIAEKLIDALNKRADGFAWKLYRHVACPNRPLPDTTTLTAEKCHAAQAGDVSPERAACSVARAVRAELTDEPKEMEFYLQELVAVLFAAQSKIKPALAEEMFRAWAIDSRGFQQRFNAFLAASADLQLGTTKVSCKDLRSALGDLSLAEKLCWSWKLADKGSVDIPLGIQQCAGLKAHSVAELLDDLRRSSKGTDDEAAIRASLQHVFASTPPVPEPSDAGASEAGATSTATQPLCDFNSAALTLVIEKRNFALRKEKIVNPELTSALKLLDSYLLNGIELRRVSGELGTVPAELRSIDPLEQMDVLVRAQRLLSFLRRAHDYVSETGGSSHATAEPLSDLAYQAFKSACGEDSKDLCSLTSVLASLFGDYRFKDIARYGVRGDLRALATKVLEQVLPPVENRQTGLCKSGERCRKFIIAFAGYALDMATNHGDDKAARAAFKNAAEDVLSETEDERRTFPRKGEATVWWETFLVPSASLRFSWSPDYFNGVGSDQFRYLISIDWLTLLRWAPFKNVGLNVSLVDLASPFTELAFRPRAHVANGGYVAWDFIRPRFDVIFAVPEFSRRLMLSAGISLKTYNTEMRTPAPGDDLPTITYRALLDCARSDDTSCVGYRGAAEFNFGLKLVF